MGFLENSSDRRKWFRCAAWQSRQRGELKLGAVRVPVRLLDQSSGGFAVLAYGLPGVEVDDTAQLHTEAGWFEVRVANVTQAPAETEDTQQTGQPVLAYRLGLDRLDELVVPEGNTTRRAVRRIRFHLARFFPSADSMVVLGVVFSLLFVILPLVALTLPSYRNSPRVKQVSRWLDRTLAGFSSFSSSSVGRQQQQPAAQRSGQTAVVTRPAADEAQELRNSLRRLSGATAFLLPEVVRKLQLSDAQQAKVREIVDATSQAFQELDGRWQAGNRRQRSEIREMILDAGRREVLDMLTDKQRARWQELVGGEQ